MLTNAYAVLTLLFVFILVVAFGGDSDRITIFGQSAGAGSVSLLTLAEPAWEFFDRAIVQVWNTPHIELISSLIKISFFKSTSMPPIIFQ